MRHSRVWRLVRRVRFPYVPLIIVLVLLLLPLYVNGELNRTVVLGVVTKFVTGEYYYLGPMMAGATLGSIPVAILYFCFMDLYVSGLTVGAVKG